MTYGEALLAIQSNLRKSLAVLEENKTKSPILKANYATLANGSKVYRDIIAKLAHLASWGDVSCLISNLVNAVTSKSHAEFPSKLKAVSSNVVLAGAPKGPIQGKLVSTRIHDNTWYNVLKKTLEIAMRSNQHAINEAERVKANALEKAEKAKQNTIAKTVEIVKTITNEIDLFELIKDDIPDSWDD